MRIWNVIKQELEIPQENMTREEAEQVALILSRPLHEYADSAFLTVVSGDEVNDPEMAIFYKGIKYVPFSEE